MYEMDESLKDGDFKEAHFCAFFHFIVTEHEEYGQLYIPRCAKEAAAEYLEGEDEFAIWFEDKFEQHTPVGKKYFKRK